VPAEAADAVLVIAAAGQPDTDLVCAVLGSTAEAGLAQAQAAGLLELDDDRLRLTHPLLGSTAYAEAMPEKRRRLHASLARVVTEPAERARHLALATSGPDDDVAGCLEAAAAGAASRGAPEAAADLAEQAAQLTPQAGGDDRRRRSTAAAWYHVRNGDLPRARILLEEVVANSVAGPARAHALRLLGEVLYIGDSLAEAIPVLRQALDEAGSEPELAGPIELDLAFTLVHTGNFLEGPPHAHAALGHAEHLGEPGLLSEALAVATVADVQVGNDLDETRLTRALELEDHDSASVLWMRPSLIAPLLWTWMGRLDEARCGFASLHRRLALRGDEVAIPMFCFHAVLTECWIGDLAAAKVYADASSDAAANGGWEVAHAFALTAQALLHAHAGDADAARGEAAAAVATFQRSGFPLYVVWPLWAWGLVELSLGDAAAAHAVLGPLTEAVAASGLVEPAAAPFVPDEIEALVGLGHLDAADELLRSLDERSRTLDRAWGLATAARCRALLLATRGDLCGAEEAIDRALIHHERVEMPIERARTLLVKGQLHRRGKRKREAKNALTEAVTIFEAAEATLWAQRAKRELARVGLRPPASSDLTATEARVAELAASGSTNREVAALLFMSPKTVEANLVRVYRKLGVRSRAELGAKFAHPRAGQPPAQT